MARATTHPNHEMISSEDVHGTAVYGATGDKIGEVDHLMIDKSSGPRSLCRDELWWISRVGT
jgi:hypothetical protein